MDKSETPVSNPAPVGGQYPAYPGPAPQYEQYQPPPYHSISPPAGGATAPPPGYVQPYTQQNQQHPQQVAILQPTGQVQQPAAIQLMVEEVEGGVIKTESVSTI
ncbi:uncharacterized protein LOC142342414 isoform X2 [Convolutriloba macropyga]|uniref:uncharacterized protein LOC142342414 isoform X2 n=1 Tax=Convolutriloba macropyga TaxID=536237 RepID=UPI003F51C194